MAVTCSDIAQLGRDLIAAGGEASERSGVSRLFYGALHRSDAWVAAQPGVASDGGIASTHLRLQHKLRNLDPQCDAARKLKGRILAAKLGALKNRRTQADYDLANHLTSSEIKAQQAETDAYIAQCDSTP